MIDTAKLKGIIAEKGLSQRKVAKVLGMTEKTFYDRMKKGTFGNVEIEIMTELLNINEPWNIFFAKDVS